MAKRRSKPKSEDRARQQRVGVLYVLTGIFTVAVGGLIAARPTPLAAQTDVSGLPIRTTVLAAVSSVDPIDDLLRTEVPVRPGHWRRINVQEASGPVRGEMSGHFTIHRSAREGVQVIVGRPWLRQESLAGAPAGEIRIVLRDDAAGSRLAPSQEAAVRRFIGRVAERAALSGSDVFLP